MRAWQISFAAVVLLAAGCGGGSTEKAGTITTVAGTGDFGSSGDGGPALSAKLADPIAVAVDASGNLYILEHNGGRRCLGDCPGRVRKVDAEGVITTVVGARAASAAGKVELGEPYGFALDGQGRIYVADRDHNRVVRVDPSGAVATVAGIGEFGFSGDGGPATKARLHSPVGVAVDSAGNIYIADDGNNRIRKVDPSGVITTIAGTGAADFSGDGGPASEARLNDPTGVAVDAAGNVYIGDVGNQRIRKVDRRGVITTVAGTGKYGFSGDGGSATRAELSTPEHIAFDAEGNLFVPDDGNNRVRKIDAKGVITTVAGTGASEFSGDGGPALQAGLSPTGVAADASGNLYIADFLNNRVRKVRLG